MQKQVLNIVVTGGPCGGKTTALDEIAKLLRSYGYTVYIVFEAATELISSGIKPFGDHKLDLKSFQSLLFDAQLYNENIRRNAANLCDNNKVAILYDRGILDNRAYIDDATFEELLTERKMSESEILMRYDMVIHLITAAIGKEEYYTTLNNTARTETVEEARFRDQKTIETWRNHPNLRIVGNDTLFDEKILKVKNHIREYIGEAEVIKQKRYLIDSSEIDLNQFSHSMIKEEIEEFAIPFDEGEMELFIKSTINGSSYYTCIKKNKNNTSKICRTISYEEYLYYRSKVKNNILSKTRYNFIDEHERFRLDLFNNHSFAILERDVTNNNRKALPFMETAIDVTGNQIYEDDSIYLDDVIENIYQKKR